MLLLPPVPCTAATRAAAVLVLVLAAGCSSTPEQEALPTPSDVTTTAPAPSPTVVATPGPTSTPSPTVTRTPTPVVGSESPAPLGQPACTAAAVTVQDADTLVSPSYKREVFVLRTTGRACQFEGYPAVDLRTPGVTVQSGAQGLQAEQPAAYTLTTATSLSFELSTTRTGTCHDLTAISVTLPGTKAAKQVATDLRVCGSVVGVSPVHRLADDE